MNVGDLVRATWKDGLVMVGRFEGHRRGYIILIGEEGERIVCNPDSVDFEIISRAGE